jgi:autotransporter translocation and assembly factor TamB
MKLLQYILNIIIRCFYLGIFLFFGWVIIFIGLTQSGLEFTFGLIGRSLPGRLQIQQFSGNLYSGFTLKNVAYEDPQQNTTLSSLEFSWQPKELLHGKIMITNFLLNHVHISLKNGSQTPSAPSNINPLAWLNHLDIKRAVIQDLSVTGKFKGIPINGSTNVLFLNNSLTIRDTKITMGNALFTLAGTMKDKWDMRWVYNAHNISSTGTVSGPRFSPQIKSHLEGKNISYYGQSVKKINGNFILDLKLESQSTLSLNLKNVKINDYLIDQMDLSVVGKLLKNQLLSTFKLFINGPKNQLSATLNLPRPLQTDLSQPLQGSLRLQFNELKTFVARNKYIKRPRGTLNGQLQLSGTFASPKLKGNLQLNQGYVKIKRTNTKLEKINVSAIFDNDKITGNGSFMAGNKQGKLYGTGNLKQLSLNLNLTGNDLLLANSSEYKIIVSPDLTFTADPSLMNLKGKIFVSSASLTPKNFTDTVTLSHDIVFIGQTQKQTLWPSELAVQIKLRLNDDISLLYENLNTTLAGSLTITQVPGSPAFATGQLYTLKGTYKAYGQTLMIREGRLLYTGNALTNPGLDIQAVKNIKTISMGGTGVFSQSQSAYLGSDVITAGVRVTGTFNQPIFSLFSIPGGMSQNDILSYILFGYPQSQISATSSLTLLKAASSLNSGTGNFDALTGKLQKALSFADITTESTEVYDPNKNSVVSTTTIGVNKQLGSKLSLHYNIGLFYPVSILNLRYQFSKHWAVQSETSTIDNGVDLLYGFERD